MVELIGSVIVALITVAGTVTVSVIGNRKITTLLNYRMDQVEKKVGVHNGFEGRIIKLEDAVSDIENDVAEIKADLKERGNRK